MAGELGVNLNNVTGTGRNGRVSVADVEQAIFAAGGSVPEKAQAQRGLEIRPVPADDSGVAATSVARRLAKTATSPGRAGPPHGRGGALEGLNNA